MGSILFFLLLFSTNVPIYDGERLFLHVFPAWALLIGLGFGWLWERLRPQSAGIRTVLAALLAAQGFGVVSTYPFGLSYYNALVGGLPGAERLGLEVTYWSDAVDDVLLDRLARDGQPDATAALLPTLYPGQGAMTTGFNRTLARRGIILQDEAAATAAEWVVVSYRTAYWPPAWRERLRRGGGRLVGVPLAAGCPAVRALALPHYEGRAFIVRATRADAALSRIRNLWLTSKPPKRHFPLAVGRTIRRILSEEIERSQQADDPGFRSR